MKKLSVLIISAMIACLHSFAYELKTGNNVSVDQPVSGNLYVSGGTVTINAPVYGDLLIAGGTVVVNDSVTGDVLVGGGEVAIKNFTGGNIRCAGGRVVITGHVGSDVAGIGGTIQIEKSAVVSGGVLCAGGTIHVNGIVNEQAKVSAGQIIINGVIGKELDCRGGNITMNGTVNGKTVLAANDITIGNAATFNGDIRYWNRKTNVDFKTSLKNSHATFDPSLKVEVPEFKYLGFASFIALLWYIGAAFLLIMLIRYILQDILPRAATQQLFISGKSLGYGLLLSVVAPLAVILCFVSLVGIPIGIILLFACILVAVLSTIITAVFITALLQNSRGYKWNKWQFAGIALVVVITLKLITAMIPFIGWFMVTLMILSTYGAILRNIKLKRMPA